MAVDCLLCEGVLLQGFHAKTCKCQTVWKIVPIHAEVVVLPKSEFAFRGVQDGGVLIGRCRWVFLWDGQDGRSPGAQDAVEFAHRGEVIGHMLENIAGDHDFN